MDPEEEPQGRAGGLLRSHQFKPERGGRAKARPLSFGVQFANFDDSSSPDDVASMIQWLRLQFLRCFDRFHFPRSGISLPACKIRPMHADDLADCEALYRLNEPGRFPDGHFQGFSKWLRGNSSLVLVVEVSGQIRGIGGLHKIMHPEMKIAQLGFGMVHPDFHRKGFGTALLLARLSILPVPDEEWIISISTVGGSHTFYKRFGFTFVINHDGGSGTKLDWYRTRVRKPDWDACRARLQEGNIIMDIGDATIPTSST